MLTLAAVTHVCPLQVYVKVSAAFRVSAEDNPYADVQRRIRQLIDVYGVKRLLHGSDFPFVEAECGYEHSGDIITAMDLSETDEQCIRGKTAELLFGPWV